VQVTVERASDGRPPAYIIIGGVTLSTFGFMVYYLFPRALLELNLPLLMYIFFGLLIGMLLGLALLSLNFEKVDHTHPFSLPSLPMFTP
jgi:xanthine/uracil permease